MDVWHDMEDRIKIEQSIRVVDVSNKLAEIRLIIFRGRLAVSTAPVWNYILFIIIQQN